MMDRVPMLEVSGAAFMYPGTDAPTLFDASLSVHPGECLCLMGVNGCGKSTLLDCILGMHKLDQGVIKLNGCDIRAMSAADKAKVMAYVPQVHERSFPYTVEHIVLMGRTAHATGLSSPSQSESRLAHDALERCGIAHLAHRPYTGLSGGEMQMTMLARALTQDTPLILMDEPTAHLDFYNELLFLETVESLVRDKRITVLMATHAPDHAFHLQAAGASTRVAVMKDGKIERTGTPDNVLTADTLQDVFKIDGLVTQIEAGAAGNIRRIIPLHTCPAKTFVQGTEAVGA